MIRVLIFCALWGAGGLTCHAQTLEEMAEQVTVLRTLQQSTTEGYKIMGGDLNNIGQITNGEYELHQTFFGSLAMVGPAVTDDAQLTALRNLQAQLVQQINAALVYWRQQIKNDL
jgi:hypothetical protein